MTAFYWHGAAMALAWLVLLPGGALVARFFKVRRSQGYPYALDDQAWWNAHRVVQSLGAALVALAGWWAYEALGRSVDWPQGHVQLGMAAMALLVLQLASPFFRGTKGGPTDPGSDPYDPATWRGDHFSMTVRRRVFEFLHKKLGYAAMAVAACAAWTGIELAGLADWWKLGVVAAVLLFAGLFLLFTLQGRRVDTWRAIWGPYEWP